jgi:lactate racemase
MQTDTSKTIRKNNIKIPYGRGFYNLKAEYNFDLLKIKKISKLKDCKGELLKKINNPSGSKPLKDIIKNKKDICIVISDITRPIPNKDILEVLFSYMHGEGIDKKNIKIIVATGSHEEPTYEEYLELLGEHIKKNYKILWNDCYSNNFIFSGIECDGHKISINKDYINSDVKILIGLIEPHLYAGYSGGRKSIVPGLCDWESFKLMHGSKIMMHPELRLDSIENNPFHIIAKSVAEKVGADFILNVIINEEKDIVNIFCGNLNKAFEEGIEYVRKHFKIKSNKKYDLIITNGGGYPLDSFFYQLVKGMNSPIPYLKKDGKLLMIAKCENGIGTKQFYELIKNIGTINDFINNIENNFTMEQWTIQAYYKVFQTAKVFLYSPIFEKYPFLENFIKRVDDINKFIDNIRSEKKDCNLGIFTSGPYAF